MSANYLNRCALGNGDRLKCSIRNAVFVGYDQPYLELPGGAIGVIRARAGIAIAVLPFQLIIGSQI